MKTIQTITRKMLEWYDQNSGVCVAYWGSVRTWKEGCQMYAEKVVEQMFLHKETTTSLTFLIGRMKWLWDREHFLEEDYFKLPEYFYDATCKEIAKRVLEICENLKLVEDGNSI